jgi:hypothetical protein
MLDQVRSSGFLKLSFEIKSSVGKGVGPSN